MQAKHTAVVLIGFQNDYFADDGILKSVVEENVEETGALRHTLALLNNLKSSDVMLVSTPILFTPDYRELVEPVGILETIREVGAFKSGSSGAEVIPEIRSFGDRIVEVPGKRGLNAFSNTRLEELLRERQIKDIVLAGVVTSVCIDSTARSAVDRGFRVTVLSDCTAGRSAFEQEFYCDNIFPIFAKIMTHDALLGALDA